MTDTSIPPDDELDDLRERTDALLAEVDPPIDPIGYIMDLEALVRWFALLYRRVLYREDGEEVIEFGDPIWQTHDQYGNHLPAAAKLQETWNRVIHDA